MDINNIRGALHLISSDMQENREYLIKLDQQNGDGDLGISMSEGYRAAYAVAKESSEKDLGKVFLRMGMAFNEAAPSSLGTITSFGFIGMAKKLRGKEDASLSDFIEALEAGLQLIMEKAKSKPGEKTILDSLAPAIQTLNQYQDQGCKIAFNHAALAASQGAENTRKMRSVHGRAAYYGDKSIGIIDGGAVVGKILFNSLLKYCESIEQ